MPVVSRVPATVVLETGQSVAVIVENLTQAVAPGLYFEPGANIAALNVGRDAPQSGEGAGQQWIGWGAGTRTLFLMTQPLPSPPPPPPPPPPGVTTTTTTGAPGPPPPPSLPPPPPLLLPPILTPVLSLLPASGQQNQAMLGTLIESASDPYLLYSPVQKKFTLFYWVNAWSPPMVSLPPSPPVPPVPPGSPPSPPLPPPVSAGPKLPPSLFSGVIPPDLSHVDGNYLFDGSYTGSQPILGEFTSIRDVPNWFKQGTAPPPPPPPNEVVIPGADDERVGPFDIGRFWVAPFTDAHTYQFPDDLSQFPSLLPPSPPPLPFSPTTTTTTTRAPGSPPPLSSSDFLSRFVSLTVPFTDTTKEVLVVLQKQESGITLNDSEKLTLDCYEYAFARFMGLNRCTRVLMRAEGYIHIYQHQESGKPRTNSCPYLVVNPPVPVLAFPRTTNKVLVGRPKMISFLRNGVFVTAAMTYRYPAAGSVTLTGGDPQVDFLMHDPSDRFEENRRMGILPESQKPSYAPPEVQVQTPEGKSLVQILFDTNFGH